MNDKVNPNSTLNAQTNNVVSATSGVPTTPQVAQNPVAGGIVSNTGVVTDVSTNTSVVVNSTEVPTNNQVAQEKKFPEQRVINNKEDASIKTIVPEIKAEVDGKKVKESKDKIKEKEEVLEDDKKNNKGPGFFQKLLAFLVINSLLIFIYFLPNIVNFIMRQEYLFKSHEKITDGVLKCTLDKKSGNLEHSYEFEFSFINNKLTRLNYIDKVTGGVEVSSLNTSCVKVQNVANGLSGVSISCNLENGVFTQTQVFNYGAINHEEAKAVYVENGGLYPEFKNKEDMDELEKKMNADGYSCERNK